MQKSQIKQNQFFVIIKRLVLSQLKNTIKSFIKFLNSLYLDSFINGFINDAKTVYVMGYSGLTNIGDEIQSIASADILKQYGYEVKYAERERLSKTFSIFKRKAVLNGWFSHNENSFPPSKAIQPIFIGFHLSNKRILNSQKSKAYFKSHEPIGCRDNPTKQTLDQLGITAKYTACPTLTLNSRPTSKTIECLVVDAHLDNPDGHTSDARDLLDYVLDKYELKNVQYVSQNCKVNITSPQKIQLAEERLVELCSSKLVITNRIHVALPCLAMEVPVIFLHANPKKDSRIESFLELFWYKTNDGEDLPVDTDINRIKNKSHYLALRKQLQDEYAKFFKVSANP